MTDFVSQQELAAHLDPMKDDIREIKGDVKTLLVGRYDNSFFGGRGHAALLVALPTVLSIISAVLIAVYL